MLSRLSGTENFPVLSGANRKGEFNETFIIDSIGGREILLDSEPSDERMAELEMLSGIGRRTKAERKAAKEVRKEKRADKKEARQEKRADKKEVRQEKRAVRKEKRAEKKEARGGSVVKKIALAPVRGAFLSLLALNFRDLAGRLSVALGKNENEVKKFAAKFGFKFDILKRAIQNGATKKPLLGAGKVGLVVATTTATTAATAAPIIIASIALLKYLGVGNKQGGAEADAELLKSAADVIAKGGEASTEEVQQLIDKAQDVLTNPNASPEQKEAAQNVIDKAQSGGVDSGIIVKVVAAAAGAGFLIWLFTRKK